MTFNRTLLVSIIIIGAAIAVLAFGNPQWRWCYLFQSQLISDPTDRISFTRSAMVESIGFKHVSPPHDYSGDWMGWGSSLTGPQHRFELQYFNGELQGLQYLYIDGLIDTINYVLMGKSVVVYNLKYGIDSRTEFLVPVE